MYQIRRNVFRIKFTFMFCLNGEQKLQTWYLLQRTHFLLKHWECNDRKLFYHYDVYFTYVHICLYICISQCTLHTICTFYQSIRCLYSLETCINKTCHNGIYFVFFVLMVRTDRKIFRNKYTLYVEIKTNKYSIRNIVRRQCLLLEYTF